jgi:hypothetical protein
MRKTESRAFAYRMTRFARGSFFDAQIIEQVGIYPFATK